MANGPLQSYLPPSVITSTDTQRQLSGPPTGLQIPIFLGTGKETLSQVDYELVRGSSSTVDQLINNEDVSERFIVDETDPDNPTLGAVDGLSSKFKVNHFPIVTGEGQGLTTNRPQDVDVTVDGVPVVVAAVDGSSGVVTLQVPPASGASVKVTYSFNRTDTLREDDVSEQVSSEPAILKATEPGAYTIVDGENDVLSLKVNGTEHDITLQSGTFSAADVAVDINSAQVTGLTASSDYDNQGRSRLQLSADGSLEILNGSANTLFGFSSGQKTDRNLVFHVYEGPIVTGENGGITTTDTDDVEVYVNGSRVQPESVDGANRQITLSDAPVVGSTVTVKYYFNSYQDTFDFLPNTGISSVERVGNAPGRNDFIRGLDFVVSDDRILWGSTVSIEAGQFTASGSNEVFDDTQITATLKDSKVYLEEVERLTDLTVTPARPSDVTVVLGNVPTKGDGLDTPTSTPSLVEIYHGPDLPTAVANGKVEVTKVDPDTRQVTVKDVIPADHKVFATYYYSRLVDDTYTITRKQSGRVEVYSDLRGENLFNVRFGTSGVADTIQWPSGVESKPDAFVSGTGGVDETVTVTFTDIGGSPATFTSREAGTYDIFEDASDKMKVILNDGDRGTSDDAVTVDLASAAFAVLVSDMHTSGSSFTVTTGSNDTFEFQLDGATHSVTLPAATHTISEVAEYIWRSVPNLTEVKGTATEDFDFDNSAAGVTYDVTINGTNVTNTIVGTATDDAATVAAALISDIESTSGTLTGGDLTDPANDFNVIANSDGTVSILASESLIIADAGGGVGDDVENVLGWDGGETSLGGSYTLGATLENVKVARTFEHTDGDYLLLRSRTTPTGPGDTSSVRILSGNANSLLGFEAFETANGTEKAVNKGATLLSDAISSTMVTNLETNESDFVIKIDGVEYTVDGSNFDGISTVGDIQTQIDNVIGGAGANVATITVEDTDKIRITSQDTTAISSVEIGDASANQYIGFSDGESAGQRRVTAEEVVAVLNNNTAAWSDNSAVDMAGIASTGELVNVAYAKVVEQTGVGDFIHLASFGTGTDTSITFDDSTETVFNDTGIGIEAGDTATGVDGTDGFSVASNMSKGSTGTGHVGQTYVDDTTGLTFTVLPAQDGDYTASEAFTLIVEEEQQVGSSVVNNSMPGLETIISGLSDVAVNDTALVTTYDKSGDEPGIGDYYYITYDYSKEDFSPSLFTRFREIQANYGELSPDNPLTLACYLALLNGASLVAAKQVTKAPNSQQAAAQDYIDALDDLKKPIQAGIRPDLIVPLSTDTSVMAATANHCAIQSSPRNRNECRALFGVASGTRPQDASQLAKNLNSERGTVLYPDSALLSLTNELGETTTYIVDGTFMAAALAGVIVSPANDVATPLTRRRIVGFDRLNRSLDEVEMNQLATSGVTVLQDRTPFIEVRQGLTTNTANRLTSTPSIIAIKDFVQQQSRSTLERFIGLKFLAGRAQDVELALTGLLNSLVENQIITSFQGVSAEPDPNDPTILRVSAFYSPVFPLLYIPINFTISSSTV